MKKFAKINSNVGLGSGRVYTEQEIKDQESSHCIQGASTS